MKIWFTFISSLITKEVKYVAPCLNKTDRESQNADLNHSISFSRSMKRRRRLLFKCYLFLTNKAPTKYRCLCYNMYHNQSRKHKKILRNNYVKSWNLNSFAIRKLLKIDKLRFITYHDMLTELLIIKNKLNSCVMSMNKMFVEEVKAGCAL